ncbi:MAG: hypothetical protein R3F54_07400 [Alphaproteobacteria bacterium]
MQEPELEEEMLLAAAQGEQILIERRSLHDVDGDVTVTLPSGEERAVGLEPAGDGIGTAQFQADERGLYRIEDGDLTTYAAMRPISGLELADMRATGERLTPLADTTGGAMVWLADDGLPAVRKTGEGVRRRPGLDRVPAQGPLSSPAPTRCRCCRPYWLCSCCSARSAPPGTAKAGDDKPRKRNNTSPALRRFGLVSLPATFVLLTLR